MAYVSASAASGESDGGLLDVKLAQAPFWEVWYLRNERLVLGLVGLVALLSAWELSVRAGFVRSIFVSSPSGVFAAGVRTIQSGVLLSNIGASLTEYFLGFFLAGVTGILIGLAAGWYRRVNYAASPVITALYTMPHVALIPLVVFWFGIGLPYKVFFVFLISFFPIVINTMAGVRNVEAAYLDVARSFQAGGLTVFRSVVLPGSVPYLMSGLRLGAGRAWVGMVVAELVGSNQGLGFMIGQASEMLDTGKMMLAIVLLGLFGVVLIEIMRRIEKRFDVWRPIRANG